MSTVTEHRLKRAEPVLLIAVGGFAGAIFRHAVAVGVPGSFPWGTLVANVLGSFLLGVLLYEARLADLLTSETRLIVGTGFLSSFTTYSTFAVQTTQLAAGGQAVAGIALGGPVLATVNVAVNYSLGFLGVIAGRAVTRGMV
jgi:CrcB protein